LRLRRSRFAGHSPVDVPESRHNPDPNSRFTKSGPSAKEHVRNFHIPLVEERGREFGDLPHRAPVAAGKKFAV